MANVIDGNVGLQATRANWYVSWQWLVCQCVFATVAQNLNSM